MIFAIGLFLASSAASLPRISSDKLPLHLRPLAGATNIVATGAGFIVLRPLASQPVPGATAASIHGRQVYFKPSDRILDLRQLTPETADVQQTSRGVFVVLLNTTAEGAKALRAWTSTHLGQQLGVFLENRLIDAPVINSPLDDLIVVDGGFTRSQAEEVRRRLLRGGAR